MEYKESKIKGIIRESLIKVIEQTTAASVKETGNPYAAVEHEFSFDSSFINNLTNETYNQIKETV